VWRWFKKKRAPDPPTFSQTVMGELEVASGAILIGDPMHFYDPIRVEDVPPGRFPVWAMIVRYPEGGERIARVGIRFRPGAPDARRPLGTIGVDSATVIVVDADVHARHWKEVGPERVGQIPLPGEDKVARLIGERFGLEWRKRDVFTTVFQEPISEELEKQILDYLRTFPEYAEYPFMYFRVETMNTFERIQEAMRNRSWSEVVLDEPSGQSLLAFASGFGDGSYPMEGQYRSGELAAVEAEFIRPAQDEILEAFPILRY
jgi:hypothetical protein